MNRLPATSLLIRLPLSLALFVCVGVGLAFWPAATHAATINVDGTICTLPDAITAANTDAISGGCLPAGSGDDTLVLVSSAYTLSSGIFENAGLNALPSVTSTITISGNDALIARTGPDLFRFFHVDSGGDLTLLDLTLRDGNVDGSGGAILNLGTLTLLNVLVESSVASGSGGAVATTATLVMTNTDLVANSAGANGGALYVASGSATLFESRLLSNVAGGTGGALQQDDGSSHLEQSCVVSNSYHAVNQSGGALIEAAGNWWGAFDGPSGAALGGPPPPGAALGAGDGVSENVVFAPFLASSILGCPTRSGSMDFAQQAAPSGDLLPGEPVSYTLSIINSGVEDLYNLFVDNTLPAIFELSGVESDVASFDGTRYRIEQLPAGQVGFLRFVGRIAETVDAGVVVTNSATLTHSLAGALNVSSSNRVVVPQLNWSASSYIAAEGSGILPVGVIISPTTAFVTVTVLATITDSVVSMPDATTVVSLTFEPGSSVREVLVPIPDDDEIMERSILLSLHEPVGAQLGSVVTALVTINDDDDDLGLAVENSGSTTEAEIGEIITYTYRITNTGIVTLTTITAVDQAFGPIAGPDGSLAPGEARVAAINYVVQADDVPVLVNTLVVTGTDALSNTVASNATFAVNISDPTSLPESPAPHQRPSVMYIPRLEQ